MNITRDQKQNGMEFNGNFLFNRTTIQPRNGSTNLHNNYTSQLKFNELYQSYYRPYYYQNSEKNYMRRNGNGQRNHHPSQNYLGQNSRYRHYGYNPGLHGLSRYSADTLQPIDQARNSFNTYSQYDRDLRDNYWRRCKMYLERPQSRKRWSIELRNDTLSESRFNQLSAMSALDYLIENSDEMLNCKPFLVIPVNDILRKPKKRKSNKTRIKPDSPKKHSENRNKISNGLNAYVKSSNTEKSNVNLSVTSDCSTSTINERKSKLTMAVTRVSISNETSNRGIKLCGKKSSEDLQCDKQGHENVKKSSQSNQIEKKSTSDFSVAHNLDSEYVNNHQTENIQHKSDTERYRTTKTTKEVSTMYEMPFSTDLNQSYTHTLTEEAGDKVYMGKPFHTSRNYCGIDGAPNAASLLIPNHTNYGDYKYYNPNQYCYHQMPGEQGSEKYKPNVYSEFPNSMYSYAPVSKNLAVNSFYRSNAVNDHINNGHNYSSIPQVTNTYGTKTYPQVNTITEKEIPKYDIADKQVPLTITVHSPRIISRVQANVDFDYNDKYDDINRNKIHNQHERINLDKRFASFNDKKNEFNNSYDYKKIQSSHETHRNADSKNSISGTRIANNIGTTNYLENPYLHPQSQNKEEALTNARAQLSSSKRVEQSWNNHTEAHLRSSEKNWMYDSQASYRTKYPENIYNKNNQFSDPIMRDDVNIPAHKTITKDIGTMNNKDSSYGSNKDLILETKTPTMRSAATQTIEQSWKSIQTDLFISYPENQYAKSNDLHYTINNDDFYRSNSPIHVNITNHVGTRTSNDTYIPKAYLNPNRRIPMHAGTRSATTQTNAETEQYTPQELSERKYNQTLYDTRNHEISKGNELHHPSFKHTMHSYDAPSRVNISNNTGTAKHSCVSNESLSLEKKNPISVQSTLKTVQADSNTSEMKIDYTKTIENLNSKNNECHLDRPINLIIDKSTSSRPDTVQSKSPPFKYNELVQGTSDSSNIPKDIPADANFNLNLDGKNSKHSDKANDESNRRKSVNCDSDASPSASATINVHLNDKNYSIKDIGVHECQNAQNPREEKKIRYQQPIGKFPPIQYLPCSTEANATLNLHIMRAFGSTSDNEHYKPSLNSDNDIRAFEEIRGSSGSSPYADQRRSERLSSKITSSSGHINKNITPTINRVVQSDREMGRRGSIKLNKDVLPAHLNDYLLKKTSIHNTDATIQSDFDNTISLDEAFCQELAPRNGRISFKPTLLPGNILKLRADRASSLIFHDRPKSDLETLRRFSDSCAQNLFEESINSDFSKLRKSSATTTQDGSGSTTAYGSDGGLLGLSYSHPTKATRKGIASCLQLPKEFEKLKNIDTE